ncbi:YfkD family protein [Bacillaceae bacterium S4-13-58]
MQTFAFNLAEDKKEPKVEEKKEDSVKEKSNYGVPSHVLSISQENTYPNSTQDQTVLEPSELTKELLENVDTPIENPELIRMLNESSLKTSPLAIGYRGMIYMGHWPINYESNETSINWEYHEINTNRINNLGGKEQQTLHYQQEEEKHVKGALTTKIDQAKEIKKMMLLKAHEETKLPLAFHTVIGQGTKKANSYGIPPKQIGTLKAFAPAVNEKGVVTFAEVYLELKGSKKKLVVKNVTRQGIGAWIPVQDYVSFGFTLKDH